MYTKVHPKYKTLHCVCNLKEKTTRASQTSRPSLSTPFRVCRFIGEAQVRFILQSDKNAYGVWMKNEIGTLGPAFVKFGQFLSTRQDLFGKEVADQLALLQDDINPVAYEEIEAIITSELDCPITDIFSSINPKYIGSASIGQVHVATLKKSGKEVAVKVQKPNIERDIRNNLMTLKSINNILLQFKSTRSSEFTQIINQYEEFLNAELDYTQELNNMILFYNALNDLPVRIPRVYKNLSTSRVLIMEYVPSIKITDVDKMSNPKEICDILVKVFLSQIIEKGIVHNDTQQGNIGVLYDVDYESSAQIVLYDFGNVIRFSKKFKDSIGMLTFSLLQRNTNDFVDLLIELEILYVVDANELLEVKEIFSYLFKYLDGLDAKGLKEAFEADEIQGINGLKINRDFVCLIRVFSLLDGTINKLDPNYSYIDALQPYTTNVWSNRTFMENMARKDISKIGMTVSQYPQMLEKNDISMMRVQSKVSSLKKEIKTMQSVQYVQTFMSILITLMIQSVLF